MIINKKIKNNSGVTIIHALVALMVFVTISGIVYRSAASNLQSLDDQKDYQQAYLTVSSAAKKIVAGIEGDWLEQRVTSVGNAKPTETWTYQEKTGGETSLIKNLIRDNAVDYSSSEYVIVDGKNEGKMSITISEGESVVSPRIKSLEPITMEVFLINDVKQDSDTGNELGPKVVLNFYMDKTDPNTSNTWRNYYMYVVLPYVDNHSNIPVEYIYDSDGFICGSITTTQYVFDENKIAFHRGGYKPIESQNET